MFLVPAAAVAIPAYEPAPFEVEWLTIPPARTDDGASPSTRWEWQAAEDWLVREMQASPTPDATTSPTPTPRRLPRVQPIAAPRATTPDPAPRTSRSVSGKASWYCKAGVSVCHYKYPAGSMVAAACGKLRAAMGSGWRGKTVVVRASSGRQVTVKLVDWCGSTTKLIDLYWEPMRRLGGTGVLGVKVSW